MAKVYLSSTVLDLKPERDAVTRWLIAADHQPVHSYVASSETVRDSCLADIERCDLYVLILGHRYGYVPERDNPEGLSITHLEFRRAGEIGLPRIALMRTSVPDISHTDLLDPARNLRLQEFHSEVRQTLRPAEFNDEAELIASLSTSVQRALGETSRLLNPPRAAEREAPHNNAPRAQLDERLASQPVSQGPGSGAQPTQGWWSTTPGMLAAAAAIITAITGLVAVFVTRDAPPPTIPTEQTAPPAAVAQSAAATPESSSAADHAAAALPRVVLAGPAEASFDKYRPSTYTVLGIESLPRTPSNYVLRFRIRLLTRSSMDMGFWDSSFRLLIDGLPSAPDSNLNELVPGNAVKEAMVSYQVPYGARSLALRIIHHDSLGEIAELPLRFVGVETPSVAAPDASGEQSVKTGDIGAGAKVKIQQSQ